MRGIQIWIEGRIESMHPMPEETTSAWLVRVTKILACSDPSVRTDASAGLWVSAERQMPAVAVKVPAQGERVNLKHPQTPVP